MNIEGLNLLSLLGNSTDLDDLQQAILGEGGAEGEFAAALMEQVEQIQQQGFLPEKLETINTGQDVKQLSGLADQVNENGNAQDLAALRGTALPVVEKPVLDIDLEQTIDALQDVMAHINEATAYINRASSAVIDVFDQVAEQLEAAINEENVLAGITGESHQEAGADTDSGMTSSVFPEVQNDQTEQKNDLQQQMEDVRLDGTLNEITKADDAFVTEKLIQEPLFGAVAQEGAEKVLNPRSFNSMQQPEQLQTAIPVIPEEEVLADLLDKENASLKPGFEPQLKEQVRQVEKPLEQVVLSNSEGLDKTQPKVATDLSQLNLLNRQMEATARTEMPAMTRSFAHPEWQQEFSERILWMHSKSLSTAELRLNPQHLGPVSIRVDVNQDQATIAFTAQNAAVREAIEAAIPKLRDMLGGQQLNLADVNVSQHSFADQRPSQGFAQGEMQQQDSQQQTVANPDDDQGDNAAGFTAEIEQIRAIAGKGLLNTYA